MILIAGIARFAQILFLYDSRFGQSSLDQFKIKLAIVQSNMMSESHGEMVLKFLIPKRRLL